MPPTQRAFGNPNVHTRVDPQTFDHGAYHHAAGLTSMDQHKQEDEDYHEKDNRIKGDGPQTGGEAARKLALLAAAVREDELNVTMSAVRYEFAELCAAAGCPRRTATLSFAQLVRVALARAES